MYFVSWELDTWRFEGWNGDLLEQLLDRLMFGSESRQGIDKSKDRCKADVRESHLVCWGGEPKPELPE